MHINQFKYKLIYSNKTLTTYIFKLKITIDQNNVITINNNMLQYKDNNIITDCKLNIKQYNKLLELCRIHFLKWLKYCNSQQLKVACNYRNNRVKGSFLYFGNLNNSYKKITDVYKHLDELIIDHKLKLKKAN